MVTTVETTPKATLMTYRSNKGIDELEKELAALENGEGQEQDEQEPEQLEPKSKEVVPQEDDEGLSTEEKSFKKRYGDLRRHQQKQEADLKKKIDQLSEELETVKQSTKTELPRSKEQVEAWVKKYPDVAAIVKSLAGEEAVQKNKDLDKRLKEIEEMSSQIALEKAENEIRKAHLDFDEIRDSDAFHNWAETQPQVIKKALYDDLDVSATSRVIDLYKADMGIKRKSPDSNAALSISPRSRAATPKADDSSSRWSESRVAKMSDRDYAKYEEEIMAAMRDGKFSYDLSRKAR